MRLYIYILFFGMHLVELLQAPENLQVDGVQISLLTWFIIQ